MYLNLCSCKHLEDKNKAQAHTEINRIHFAVATLQPSLCFLLFSCVSIIKS